MPYLGVQEGLFAAEGLEVTIQSGRGSSDVVTKLGTGAADLGTGGLAALLQARARPRRRSRRWRRSTRCSPMPSSPPKAPAFQLSRTLPARPIATATFSSSNVSWPLVLKANEIDPAKVDLLKADPGALAPMLATGKVAATINWVTVAPAFAKPLAETGKKLKVIAWSDLRLRRLWAFGVRVRENTDRAPRNREEIHARLHEGRLPTAIADPTAAATAFKAMVPEVDVDVAASSLRRRSRSSSMLSARKTAKALSKRRCWQRPGSGPPKAQEHAARQARSGNGGRPFVPAQVKAGRGSARAAGAAAASLGDERALTRHSLRRRRADLRQAMTARQSPRSKNVTFDIGGTNSWRCSVHPAAASRHCSG